MGCLGFGTIVSSTLITTGDYPTVQVGDDSNSGDAGGFLVTGSIIAGPATSARCHPSTRPQMVSGGWNMVTDACGLDEPTDQVSTDPLLAPLADNGGPTPTYLPDPSSPAVDAIPSGTPGLCQPGTTTDQRGEPRPSGVGCDIGSIEVQHSVEVDSVDVALSRGDARSGRTCARPVWVRCSRSDG